MSGHKTRKLVSNYPLLVDPIISWHNFSRKLLDCHHFREGSQSKTKNSMELRGEKFVVIAILLLWENWKFFTGFRDMTDFVRGNRDPTPPLLAPYRRHSYKKLEAVNLIRNNIRGRALDYIWEIDKHRSRAIFAIVINLRPHVSFEVNPSFDKVFVWSDFFVLIKEV